MSFLQKFLKLFKKKEKNKKSGNKDVLKDKAIKDYKDINSYIKINSESLDKIGSSIPEEQTLYKLSKFFSNFSDNTRLKIISCLSFGELCVGDISKVLNMNQTTISHQLAFLKSTGTVKTRRDGKIIYYSLAAQNIEECLTYGTNFIAY